MYIHIFTKNLTYEKNIFNDDGNRSIVHISSADL